MSEPNYTGGIENLHHSACGTSDSDWVIGIDNEFRSKFEQYEIGLSSQRRVDPVAPRVGIWWPYRKRKVGGLSYNIATEVIATHTPIIMPDITQRVAVVNCRNCVVGRLRNCRSW